MEPFSHENGLLTALGKRMRPALHRKYDGPLQAVNAELERRRREELLELREGLGDLSVLATVVKA